MKGVNSFAPTKGESPPLSVVMPVYNALPYLDTAIESILTQSFPHFEFVILDDASTDGSGERLSEWARRDPRIRLVASKVNLGPVKSSERVARAAAAEIVARMDADDISCPDRLSEQFHILQVNPDVGVVGGLCEVIDSTGRKVRDADLWRLSTPSVLPPFGHGPLMYRRRVFDAVGGYRLECEYWEDHDLIIRMSQVAKVLVIPRAIYQTRVSIGSTRMLADDHRLEKAMVLAYEAVRRLEEHRPYQPAARTQALNKRIDPRVFVSLGSVALRAGRRPRVLKRLLRRGDLSFDRRTLSALGWAAWAAVSPRSLRTIINSVLKIKNSAAARNITTNEPLLWSPTTGIVSHDATTQSVEQ